jgi:hypothetical protein
MDSLELGIGLLIANALEEPGSVWSEDGLSDIDRDYWVRVGRIAINAATPPSMRGTAEPTVDRADLVIKRAANMHWITVHNEDQLKQTIRIALDMEVEAGGPYPAPVG